MERLAERKLKILRRRKEQQDVLSRSMRSNSREEVDGKGVRDSRWRDRRAEEEKCLMWERSVGVGVYDGVKERDNSERRRVMNGRERPRVVWQRFVQRGSDHKVVVWLIKARVSGLTWGGSSRGKSWRVMAVWRRFDRGGGICWLGC